MTTVPKELAAEGQTAKGATPSRWRDLAAAVSLANLCFFGFWHKILYAPPVMEPVWTWRDLLAIAVNVSALAVLFWMLIRLGKRSRRLPGWHSWLYMLTPMILLRLLQLRYRLWASVESSSLPLLLAAAIIVLAPCAVARWRRSFLAAAEVLTLCLVAFALPSSFQAAWVVYRDLEVAKAGLVASAPLLPVRPGQPRVVWIVFDEMDWRYVFPWRPSSLQMPEMDRLRAQSIYAESAFEPGVGTYESMLSYLAGRQVYTFQPTGKAAFRLLFLDEPKQADLPGPPNLFSKARQAGFNTAVVGWALPYCRLLHESLNRCYWESLETRVRDSQPSLVTSFRSQLRSLSPLEDRQRHLGRSLAMLEEARQAVADPKLGLVVVHLAVPHEPAIYRRDRGELTLFNFRPDWYFDNLALSDRTLGALRMEMERAGLWDQSTVIVTSDHALRWQTMLEQTLDSRIPFLVKLAGQKQGVAYNRPLRTLVAHDLTLALLRGELSRPEEVTSWLDQQAMPVPSGGLPGAEPQPPPAGSPR